MRYAVRRLSVYILGTVGGLPFPRFGALAGLSWLPDTRSNRGTHAFERLSIFERLYGMGIDAHPNGTRAAAAPM